MKNKLDFLALLNDSGWIENIGKENISEGYTLLYHIQVNDTHWFTIEYDENEFRNHICICVYRYEPEGMSDSGFGYLGCPYARAYNAEITMNDLRYYTNDEALLENFRKKVLAWTLQT